MQITLNETNFKENKNGNISYKRKSDDPSCLPSRKNKRYYDSTKNAIQMLGEMFPGIDYDFEKSGSDHDPCFQAQTTINGVTYKGLGSSKQRAKLEVANQVLARLSLIDKSEVKTKEEQSFTKFSASHNYFQSSPDLSFVNSQESFYTSFLPASPSASPPSTDQGFYFDPMPGRDRPLYTPPSVRNSLPHVWPSIKSTSPITAQMNKKTYPATHVIGPMLPPEAAQQGFSQLFTNKPPINIEKARCYPVMVLSELFPEMQINWSEGTGRGDRQFKVEAEVQGKRFFGEGRSKKVAKLNLAKTVLLCMYDIHDFKESEITPKSQKAKADETTHLEKKFPLTQLKELIGEELTYDVVQHETTPEEEKMFQATVIVKGVAYEATGKSRNLAKLRAAKKALEVFRPKPVGGEADEKGKKLVDTSRHPTMVFYELYRDVVFTESESKGNNGLTEYCMEAEVEGNKYSMKASSKKKAKLRLVLTAFEELRNIPMNDWTSIDLKEVLEDKQLSANPAANHPIVLLLKLNPQTRFEVTEDYSSNASSKYKATAHVGDRQFNGEGANKKTAKTCAARYALQTLYGIDPDTYVEDNRSEYFVNTEPKYEVSIDICNKVSHAVQEKYTQIFQGEAQCKVIAAFVLAKYSSVEPSEDEIPEMDVVSIGTGTKCITGDQINHKGETLNDCHGEIIACRGFRQYLYEELNAAMQGDGSTVLELKTSGKYSLKENIFLYLFVNTAPCGDGRVFTLQTQQQGAKNKTAGLLRTKIENGQGTIPVPENSVQTSDGILEGERLRTMSCSDKILKWNVIGVQGALLSFFMEPVYMSGIIVGLHYHYDALYRALYKRACKTDDCPEPFHVNKPLLGTPNNADTTRDTSKATSNSFNWYHNQPTVEAVNATTGQTVILTPSRLCKLNFFNKFIQLWRERKLKMTEPKTYHAAKLLAKEYQRAKECFFKALEETTCGKWVGKPYEHDMFGY